MTLSINRTKLITSIILTVSCCISGARAGTYEELLGAIGSNDILEAEKLFARGIDVNTADSGGNTLLIIAVRQEFTEMVRRLLVRRPILDARNGHGETALMLAAAKGNMDLVKLLVGHGAKVNVSGWNPLIYAAWSGRTEVVKYLLDHGAQIDAVAPSGISALMMAARGGHFETVKLLLWEVADPNLRSESGATALGLALKGRNTEIADLLKQAGAKE